MSEIVAVNLRIICVLVNKRHWEEAIIWHIKAINAVDTTISPWNVWSIHTANCFRTGKTIQIRIGHLLPIPVVLKFCGNEKD